MNTIIWKGVPSTNIEGLLICDLPPITKPPLRVKETTIDGRDGSIIEELGYSSYDKTITIGLRGNFILNNVIKYFTGEGEIIFSNEPDKVYTAKVIGQIDYNRLLRFRTAVVKFRVQPFKHKHLEAYKEAQTVTAEGTSIVVSNKEDANLKTFSICGKTTQDGTPTPDAPVELVSVGAGGSITVSVTDGEGNVQTVVAQTPNGLHGIPVSSGGNYTDANGQQWICDEVDLARGVYVKRINIVDLGNASGGWREAQPVGSDTYRFAFSIEKNPTYLPSANRYGMCNALAYNQTPINQNNADNSVGVYGKGGVFVRCDAYETVGEFIAWAKSIGLKVQYVLAIPIETALSAEELSVYAELHTNEPNATVLNDANTYMKLEYFKPFEVFNEGLENSKPIMVLRGSGTVGVSVNGIHIFDYTFPDGETEVVIDSEKEDAYLGEVLKNRNMNGEFPTLLAGTNKIEWSGYVESIEILPRSRWL